MKRWDKLTMSFACDRSNLCPFLLVISLVLPDPNDSCPINTRLLSRSPTNTDAITATANFGTQTYVELDTFRCTFRIHFFFPDKSDDSIHFFGTPFDNSSSVTG